MRYLFCILFDVTGTLTWVQTRRRSLAFKEQRNTQRNVSAANDPHTHAAQTTSSPPKCQLLCCCFFRFLATVFSLYFGLVHVGMTWQRRVWWVSTLVCEEGLMNYIPKDAHTHTHTPTACTVQCF